MVKQFTIPCQFGNDTSPVTLYIGHPEATHHPVKFQSDWLSSAKGGTIPQDLMDTLQKLHDLSIENGADFEELCYYALISATQHGSGGVSPDDINKYADEFVKKEGKVETNTTNQTEHATEQENNVDQQNENNANNSDVKEAEQVAQSANETQNKQDNITNTEQKQEEEKPMEKILPTLDASSNNQTKSTEEDIMGGQTTQKEQAEFNENEQILKSFSDTEENNTSSNNNTNNNNNNNSGGSSSTYSQEDDDLLLDDDLSTF